MSMSDEQFEKAVSMSEWCDDLRARDVTQREALARVEAEHATLMEQYDSVVRYGNELLAKHDAAQAQLAEAVGLLEKVTRTTGWDHRDGPLLGMVHDFLVPHREAAFMKSKGGSHAQAEQQEAQGAQAGDERAKFLTDEAYWVSQVLEDIGGMEPSWIEEDDVELHLEDDGGNSTTCTVSITEFSRRAASLIRELQARAALATQPAVRGAEHE